MLLPAFNTVLTCVVGGNCTSTPNHFLVDCGICLEPVEPVLIPSDYRFWMWLLCATMLIAVSGTMSGLIIAVLSSDVTTLQATATAGIGKGAKYAKRLLPLAKRHHLVLASLVFANVAVNECLPKVLDMIMESHVAIVISVTAVVLFGEILPQAMFTRYSFSIGFYLAWLVWGTIGLFFIVSYPLALVLDWTLGKDRTTYYRRAELRALVELHASSKSAAEGEPHLTDDEVKIITAALDMTGRPVGPLATPLKNVHMISVDSKLDEPTLRGIMNSGHSRIPVHEGDSQNIVGIILAKKLILIDPMAMISVRDVVSENINSAFIKPRFVDAEETLHKVLDLFQTGETHMAFVRQKTEAGKTEVIGILTLEHILEELLQEQIWDESDKLRQQLEKGEKPGAKRFGVTQVPRRGHAKTPRDRTSVDRKTAADGDQEIIRGRHREKGEEAKLHRERRPKTRVPESIMRVAIVKKISELGRAKKPKDASPSTTEDLSLSMKKQATRLSPSLRKDQV